MNYLHRKRLAIMKSQTMKGVIRTVSGYPLTLPDCAEGNLLDYKVYGNTVGGNSVGDYDSESGKYVIPVIVNGLNQAKRWSASTYRVFYGIPVSVGDEITVIVNWKTSSSNQAGLIPRIYSDTGLNGLLKSFPEISTSTQNQDVVITYTMTHDGYFTMAYGSGTYLLTFQKLFAAKGTYTIDDYIPYRTPITTNIYLDEPVAVNESVDYGTAKVSIPVYIGTNIITVETTVSPSNMEVSYYSDVEEVT